MPLVLLGLNQVNLEDNWVLYQPFNAVAGNTYLMETQVFTNEPELVGSYWVARYAYATQDTNLATPIEQFKIFFEPVAQYFEFTISPIAAPAGLCTFAVRRFSFFGKPTNLPSASVALAIDPTLFY